MRFSPIDLIMPHYCCSCGAIGSLLCEYCKYDIINDVPVQCVACLKPAGRFGEVCRSCATPYTRGWTVGYHRDALRGIMTQYKFKGARAAGAELAGLLHEVLPQWDMPVIVTAVPTARPHVRQRGYDQTAIIAKKFAKLRGSEYVAALERAHNHSQRGATKRQRREYAATAFKPLGPCKQGVYLLIDDVLTTGATLYYAAQALLEAGATEVWVAAINRQPLD